MANTPFLLQSKFNVNPLLQQTFHLPRLRSFHPIKLSYGVTNAFKSNNSSYKVIRGSRKLGIKCFLMSPKLKGEKSISGNADNDLKTVAVGTGIDEVFWRSIKNVLKVLQKPLITGVLLGLLLLCDHRHCCIALAASGGRMGGSSFSSSSSGSSYSSSSSGWGSYSSDDDEPSSKSFSTRTKRSESSISAANSAPTSTAGGESLVEPAIAMTESIRKEDYCDTEKTSVIKLQVGLMGTGRSVQRDLNQIAEAADTSTVAGLSYILQETIQALLRHPDYCISGYSSVDVKRSVEESEIRFEQLSVEERGKFDEETLVNVNNIKKKKASTQTSNNGVRSEYIVITIIVAAGGVHKLPPIKSSARLKEALQKLASIPSSNIMAVEVLWTPQNENDTLTKQELLEDYSLLRPL